MSRTVALLLVLATACTGGGREERRPERSPSPPSDATTVREFAEPRSAAFDEAVPPSCPDGVTPDVKTLTWRKGASMAVPRTEVAAAALAQRIYVAGGFSADGRASAVVEAYDTKADAWTRIADLPEPRHHAALVAADGRLWLVGGYDEDGEPTSTVWSWSDGSAHWRAAPSLPSPRGALAAVVVHDGIHAIGGATGLGAANQLTDEHALLARGADEWTVLDPLPEPRDHLAAAALETRTSVGGGARRGGQIFVTGGRHLSLDTNEARVDVFDVPNVETESAHWTWKSLLAMPRGRGGTAAAMLGVLLVTFGGEEPGGTIGPVDYLEVEDGVWCGAPPMPTPRHGLGAVTVGRRIYVVGGGPTPGLSVSAANEILEISG